MNTIGDDFMKNTPMAYTLPTLLFLVVFLSLSVLASVDAYERMYEDDQKVSDQRMDTQIVDDEVAVSAQEITTTRTGRNPQTGKEIKIAAGVGGATIVTDAGNAYDVAVEVTHTALDKATPKLAETICSRSRNEIVCEVTPFDGDDTESRSDYGRIYCWGNNELRECPAEHEDTVVGEQAAEMRGSGGGKVSVQDISVRFSDEHDATDDYSLALEHLKSLLTIDSDDTVELTYVWYAHEEPQRSSDAPAETLSLSFTKVEVSFGGDSSGSSLFIDVPEMEFQRDALLFTGLVFDTFAVSEQGERCRVSQLLTEGDCQDVPLDAASVPDYLDADDDGDGILTAVEEDFEQLPGVIDKTTPVLYSFEGEGLDEADAADVRAYLSTLTELTGRDLGFSIALLAIENPNVREVRYNDAARTIEVEHDETVRFLGFIRMNARALTIIDEQGNEEMRLPWWTVLAATSHDSMSFTAAADAFTSTS